MSAPMIYVQDASADYHLARIPAFPGCVASGKTREEAIANVRRTFVEYRELLRGRGVSIDHWKDLDPSTFAVGETPAGGLLPEDEPSLEEHELR
ncbi:MAG TPA: type II toxin-antitoxin system HicB family antitoxin, partial [Candidatus Limnocylindria bacterium]|nr:type II toxin-antitoxin system HicB family antitoxin [Candidatus Limnocylindria bacterium]